MSSLFGSTQQSVVTTAAAAAPLPGQGLSALPADGAFTPARTLPNIAGGPRDARWSPALNKAARAPTIAGGALGAGSFGGAASTPRTDYASKTL